MSFLSESTLSIIRTRRSEPAGTVRLAALAGASGMVAGACGAIGAGGGAEGTGGAEGGADAVKAEPGMAMARR